MPIKLAPANDRGFLRGRFKDRYGADCSIQKSSLAEEDCIWLGCDHETRHHVTGDPVGARMHLTRDMASDLLPILQCFVDTGGIEPEDVQAQKLKIDRYGLALMMIREGCDDPRGVAKTALEK